MITNFRLNKKGPYGIILTHGLLSNINSQGILLLENFFNEIGISTISFDIFGHGNSKGNILNLKLSDCCKQIEQMEQVFINNGIVCKYLYGTSFSTLPILKFGNEKKFIDLIILKTPIFNYRYKREKDLGIYKMEEWKRNGIIKIIDEENGRPPIFQKYDFMEDYDINFSDIFVENKKNLFIGAGIYDKEIEINELRILKNNKFIELKEYEDGHRFSGDILNNFINDIKNHINCKAQII